MESWERWQGSLVEPDCDVRLGRGEIQQVARSKRKYQALLLLWSLFKQVFDTSPEAQIPHEQV